MLMCSSKEVKLYFYLNYKRNQFNSINVVKELLDICCNYKYQIFIDKFGKPRTNRSNLHFNISHSNNMMLVGISDDDLGVDIEFERELDEITVEAFKNRSESISNRDHPISLWTVKEAVMKYIGKGLVIEPLDVKIKNSKEVQVHNTVFNYQTQTLFEQYHFSVVMKGEFIIESIEIIIL